MDMNQDGDITMDEYITFWEQVRQSGTKEKTVLAELKTLHQRLSFFKELSRLSKGVDEENKDNEQTGMQRTFT